MKRFVATFVLLLSIASPATATGLIEESIRLPARFEGVFGADTANLDALVIRPDDGARHPLAVLNHGTTAGQEKHKSPRGMRGQALEFARRGWVSVTFTRRSFGASEGSFAEHTGKSCDRAVYEPAARAAAEDVREVIRLMAEKPYVDGSRVISVGQSTGGLATVALTAAPPPGLVAAINFAGGHGASGHDDSVRPNMVCNESALIEAFAAFGKTSRIPMLWVYAENDHYFGPALAKKLYAAFTEGGGEAEFIAAPAFGSEGHFLFSRAGTPLWTKYVDAFLEKQKLKLLDLPLPIVDGSDVRYPSGLNEPGRISFLDFLDARGHKAFVMSAGGHYCWFSGRDSVDVAVGEA
ncbi:MAG TPA: CocE/NonD family hydrolase, partial [Telmatospirillum sp.]|nr:CocE/NonD family hydrolase [Telmatospirillum sp.]